MMTRINMKTLMEVWRGKIREGSSPLDDSHEFGGIRFVGFNKVLDHVLPNYRSDYEKHLQTAGEHAYPSYEESWGAVNAWATANDGMIYSYNVENKYEAGDEAAKEAADRGLTVVVMEYLS